VCKFAHGVQAGYLQLKPAMHSMLLTILIMLYSDYCMLQKTYYAILS